MAQSKASTLVTGGAGYVGSHVVLALLDAGHRVVVLDNLTTGFRWLVDPRASFFEGDITNESLVRAVIELHRIEAIVQCAGTSPASGTSGDPLLFYRNNTAATRSLIESAVTCGVSVFLFSSTAEAYALPCPAPVPETAKLEPADPYPMSKLIVERMLADTARAHPLGYGVLRYFNAVGADPAGRSGQVNAGAVNLVQLAVEAVVGMHDNIDVRQTGAETPDGSAIRDYVHVSDLAEAHVAMLDGLRSHPGRNLTLNCGSGTGYSDLEVLDAAERVTNVRIARRFAGCRQDDPPVLVADIRAIGDMLGWSPRSSGIEDMIRDAFAWEIRLPRLLALHGAGKMPSLATGSASALVGDPLALLASCKVGP